MDIVDDLIELGQYGEAARLDGCGRPIRIRTVHGEKTIIARCGQRALCPICRKKYHHRAYLRVTDRLNPHAAQGYRFWFVRLTARGGNFYEQLTDLRHRHSQLMKRRSRPSSPLYHIVGGVTGLHIDADQLHYHMILVGSGLSVTALAEAWGGGAQDVHVQEGYYFCHPLPRHKTPGDDLLRTWLNYLVGFDKNNGVLGYQLLKGARIRGMVLCRCWGFKAADIERVGDAGRGDASSCFLVSFLPPFPLSPFLSFASFALRQFLGALARGPDPP